MNLSQELLLFGVGAFAGYINVMAGGGSLLTVPAMLFMGLPAPVANGTNRIAILAQSLVSCAVFLRKGLGELKLSLTLGLAALPGALIGALLGVRLEGVWFNRLLAVIMIAVMLMMFFERRTITKDINSDSRPRRVILTHVLMLGVGFYGGIIQVGVGFIIMPILHRVMGLDLLRVNMHKIFLIVPFTVLSLIIFAGQAGVSWTAGFFLALGNALGGWLGTHMMISRGEKIIKVVFNLVLAAFIVKLIFFS
ncbi:MAG TPA: sulfite exporter TauE/SafE family protein [Gammaproteobacteria bacterium]